MGLCSFHRTAVFRLLCSGSSDEGPGMERQEHTSCGRPHHGVLPAGFEKREFLRGDSRKRLCVRFHRIRWKDSCCPVQPGRRIPAVFRLRRCRGFRGQGVFLDAPGKRPPETPFFTTHGMGTCYLGATLRPTCDACLSRQSGAFPLRTGGRGRGHFFMDS